MDREDVSIAQLTETQVLHEVLGETALTKDRAADLARAVRVINRDRSAKALQIKIILHALHAELGTWDLVATRLDTPKTTVWSWAHAEI